MNVDRGRTPKQIAHTFKKIGFWARSRGINTLDEQLLGLDLDEGLSGYSDATVEPTTPEIDWAAVPRVTGAERERLLKEWGADNAEDNVAHPRRSRKRARYARRIEEAKRVVAPVREVSRPIPHTRPVAVVPAPGVVGPRIDCVPTTSGWFGACSECGAIGLVNDPYRGALDHLNRVHPNRRAA